MLFLAAFSRKALPGIFPTCSKSIPQQAICLSVEASVIDAVLNVAVFAAFLCIVGFSAWAHKQVAALPSLKAQAARLSM
jgi:hypothetical protein